jgi:hypothetical protein
MINLKSLPDDLHGRREAQVEFRLSCHFLLGLLQSLRDPKCIQGNHLQKLQAGLVKED